MNYNNFDNNDNNQKREMYSEYNKNNLSKFNNNSSYVVLNDEEMREKKLKRKIINYSLYGVFLIVIGISFYLYRIDKYEFYINNPEILLANQSSYQIKLLPKNVQFFDYKNYKYEVEDTSIADVDEYGVVVAKKTGTTKVKIRYKNALTSKEIDLHVEDIDVNSIDFSKDVSLNTGESEKITPIINHQEDINKNVEYESTNKNIATVDNHGNVNAISEGETKVIAKSDNGVNGEVNIVIKKNEKEVQSIALNETSINLKKGGKTKLIAIITPIDAVNQKVTWISDNGNVSVDDNGNIEGKNLGTATITANVSNGKSASCKVTVVDTTIRATKISLNASSKEMRIGQQEQLVATITPTNVTNRNISWSSSNNKVVTVQDGKITAVGSGSAVITAKTENGKIAICKINVATETKDILNPKQPQNSEVSVTGISLNITDTNLDVGGTVNLIATISPNNATNKAVVWTSNNTSVATVENGTVTAKSVGTAVITAKTANGKTATCIISVKSTTVNVSSISIQPEKISLDVGDKFNLISTISPTNATNKTITWSSSDSSVAKVSNNGTVTALKVGTTIITAKSNNGKTAKSTITVAALSGQKFEVKKYIIKYNTVMIDVDEVFTNLKKIYGKNSDDELLNHLTNLNLYKKDILNSAYDYKANKNDCKVNYAYRLQSEIKNGDLYTSKSKIVYSRNNLSLYVPDFYYICAYHKGQSKASGSSVTTISYIDDSVTIGIEKEGNNYYMPIYFLTSIPGIEAKIDGLKVYKSDNTYMDSITAISKQSGNHKIDIIVDNKSVSAKTIAAKYKIKENQYYGQENGALWREEAKKKTEKNRKNNYGIVVKDGNGNPINGADIKIQMKDNNFKFGSAVANITDNINSNYFNGVGHTNTFRMDLYYAYKKANNLAGINKIRTNLIDTANSKGMGYVRGHCLYWDERSESSYGSAGMDILGTASDNNPNHVTMAFVYNKYKEYNSDKNYTNAEKTNINNWITQLKTKYKNFIYNYIRTTVKDYPGVDEWDLFNEIKSTNYFRYYLFDEHLLTDNKFLEASPERKKYNANIYKSASEMTNAMQNDAKYSEYIDFLVECVKVYRENTKSRLVINGDTSRGIYFDYGSDPLAVQDALQVKEINRRLKAKGMEEIDALGFQNHVYANYYLTPNAYSNAYSRFLDTAGVIRGRVTEYDNFYAGWTGEYKNTEVSSLSQAEKNVRASYLKDSLISMYGNSRIGMFWFWLYNSDTVFTKEERDAYTNTVYNWLHYTENGKTQNGVYNTRLYRGQYSVQITANGKTVTKSINVVANDNSKIEVTI